MPVTCDNCDVRRLRPTWCGYYDRYCDYCDDDLKGGDNERTQTGRDRERTDGVRAQDN